MTTALTLIVILAIITAYLWVWCAQREHAEMKAWRDRSKLDLDDYLEVGDFKDGGE